MADQLPEKVLSLLNQATMRVSDFGNPTIKVVRRDEAEAIVRSALYESSKELRAEIADLKEVLADKRRLARELDVAMHGEADAAKQASLCDLVPLAKELREKLERAQAALVHHNDMARSFYQIANRIATEFSTHELATNFGGFADKTEAMLKQHHEVANEARHALAIKEAKHG